MFHLVDKYSLDREETLLMQSYHKHEKVVGVGSNRLQYKKLAPDLCVLPGFHSFIQLQGGKNEKKTGDHHMVNYTKINFL